MVTGNAPYNGSDSMVINKHIKAAIPSPRSIVPDLPESICWVIEKMMAKSPEDRYQTYEELRLDFLRVKAGENPKLQRIESSKSTIARIEDFGSMWLQICKLDEKVKTLQKKQYILITIIIILIVICIILLAILFHIK